MLHVPITMGPENKPKIYRKSREDLKNYGNGLMAICPSRPAHKTKEEDEGEHLFSQFGAWGFISLCREPEYFGLYVSSPTSAVKYFGVVEEVIDPRNKDPPIDDFREHESYEEGNKMIILKKDMIVELDDMVPYEGGPIQGLRYTTLNKFIQAETTDDLWD